MRPNQQNRRMRGRNNSNRKGPNPLTRTYESNGPDVKIRGSAQQVADKYGALARDAMSAGDRVMAENYLQHAEHYNRIIAAAMAQAQPQRDARDDDDDGDERNDGTGASDNRREDRDNRGDDNRGDDERGNDGSGPQPVIEGTPAEVALGDEQGESQGGRRNRRPRRRDRDQDGEAAAKTGGETSSGDEEKSEPVVARDSDGETEKPKRTRRPRKAKAEGDSGEGGENGQSGGENAVEAAE